MDKIKVCQQEWSCVSYLNEEQLQECILHFFRTGLLHHYMYIYHNKDDNEPHFHLALFFTDNVKYYQVLRGFCGYLDDRGNAINTMCDPAHHPEALYDYFLHQSEKSKVDGKASYSEEDLRSDNLDFFKNYQPKLKIDKVGNAMSDLMSGCSLPDCISKYGRDFVIYYSRYKELLFDLGYQYDTVNKKFV